MHVTHRGVSKWSADVQVSRGEPTHAALRAQKHEPTATLTGSRARLDCRQILLSTLLSPGHLEGGATQLIGRAARDVTLSPAGLTYPPRTGDELRVFSVLHFYSGVLGPLLLRKGIILFVIRSPMIF